MLREVPVGSAAVYVPGRARAYPSTVVMGVVTARAAGVLDVAVCAPPGPDGQIDPVILGTCRLCGVERVYRMGGAQAIAALAYGTETRRARRRDRRPGQPVRAGGQAPARRRRVGIDGFAGPSDLLVAARRATPASASCGWRRSTCSPRPSTARAASSSRSRPRSAVCDALADDARASSSSSARPSARRRSRSSRSPTPREALELANAFAPEHLQLIGAEIEALAPLVRCAGCLFVGADSATAFGDYVAGSNHVLPTGGAARFASMLSPRHFRRTMAEVRIGAAAAKLAAAGAPIARAEGFECTQSRWRRACGRIQSVMSRTATIERKTAETDVRLTLTLDGSGAGARATGVGFLDHMLDLLARHGRIDLDVSVSGDLQTGAHHTAEDTAIVLGQALDAALGDRAGHRPLRLGDRADGRGARELRDRHLRAPVHAVRGRPAARRRPAASSTS